MRIGEVAARSGVSARMLRHYDDQGLVRPSGRTSAGYREYSPADVRTLFHVECLRTLGMPLAEIATALSDPGRDPSAALEGVVRQTRERIARDTAVLARLEQVGAGSPGDWGDVLDVVGLLRSMDSDFPGHRQRAALASGADGPVPAEVLRDLLRTESDLNVAGALRWSMERSGADEGELLADYLESPDAGVRLVAVRALDGSAGESARRVLLRARRDHDDEVRHQAVLALGRLGGVDVVPDLVDLVVHGPHDVPAAETLGALAAGADDDGDSTSVAGRVIDRLRSRLDAGLPVAARSRIAQGLAEIPGDEATRLLEHLAADPDETVAVTARYLHGMRPGSE